MWSCAWDATPGASKSATTAAASPPPPLRRTRCMWAWASCASAPCWRRRWSMSTPAPARARACSSSCRRRPRPARQRRPSPRTRDTLPEEKSRPMSFSSPISVFVIDDHTLFRRGLIALIAQDAGLRVVGEAGDAGEALRLVPALAPQAILLDNHLPGVLGADAIAGLRAASPGSRDVMLTDRKSTRLNSSHQIISYAVFC